MSRAPGAPFDGMAGIADVVAAYRLLMGREPDAGGRAHFESLVRKGLRLEDLARQFLESDEYRARRARPGGVVEVDCGGYVVLVERDEDDFGWKIALHHTWEPHIVAMLRSLLRPGATFVDIGANVGVMSFAGAVAVGPSGRVIAVEPNHRNLQRLYGGIVRNAFANVRVVPFAAAASPALLSIKGGTSNTYLTAASADKEFVQVVVLDDALGELPALDLVKIDIAGFEPEAIAGFRRNLARHRPAVLIEYNPRCLRDHAGHDPRAVGEDLFTLLEDVRIVEHAGKTAPVASPAELWSLWQARNRAAVEGAILPEGMLHFDLVGRVRA